MSDAVWIVMIVAAAVVVTLYLYRRRLRDFFLKADRQGLEARLSTHPEDSSVAPAKPGVKISGNVQRGREHEISVARDDVEINDNLQEGRGQKITVKPDRS